jgi:2-oxo-3-hexenedioate decarboxylase
MGIDERKIKEIAEHLDRCELERRETDKITDEYEITLEEAYVIQDELKRRKISRGHKIIGYKIGLTSRAKMRQMGVGTPIFGFLADYFMIPNGGKISLDELIHPKIEPEIAFIIKKDLEGPCCTPLDVLASTELIAPAIEVIDSRYRDFKFDLPSVVADNCSSSRFIVGCGTPPESLDLRNIGVIFEKNGEILKTSSGSAVLGNPANSVAMLVNHLYNRFEILPRGSIVLSGALSEAIRARKGDSFRVISSIGCASVKIV